MTGRARTVAVIAAIAAAAWIGYRVAPGPVTVVTSSPAQSAAPSSATSAPAPVRVAARPVVITAPVSQVAAPAPAEPEEVAPTAPQLDAADAADELLDAAISRGAWSTDDWRGLDPLLVTMTPAQRHQALDAVSAAVNQGQMTFEPPGP